MPRSTRSPAFAFALLLAFVPCVLAQSVRTDDGLEIERDSRLSHQGQNDRNAAARVEIEIPISRTAEIRVKASSGGTMKRPAPTTEGY